MNIEKIKMIEERMSCTLFAAQRIYNREKGCY